MPQTKVGVLTVEPKKILENDFLVGHVGNKESGNKENRKMVSRGDGLEKKGFLGRMIRLVILA